MVAVRRRKRSLGRRGRVRIMYVCKEWIDRREKGRSRRMAALFEREKCVRLAARNGRDETLSKKP